MASPYQYLTTTGVIVPDTAGLLLEVQVEYQTVFGSDLIVTPDTPQGVLITAEALARANEVSNNAAVANQINPNIAGGTFLDAIMAFSGLQRTAQTQTLVTNVTVAGVAATSIPQGSQAKTAAGDIFLTAGTVVLDGSGNGIVDFYSQAYGAIPCAANALSTIVSNVLGWETVDNNPSSTPNSVTTLGQSTQSDQQARALRNNTLAFQGVALAVAITSALYATEGVKSLTFQENIAPTTETINGISMVSHSIYVCVDGGTDTAVAAALLENKSSGCAWNGGTEVNVIEPASGQVYSVLFDRPTPVGILVVVNTVNGNVDAVTQSVIDYSEGAVQIIDQNGITSTLPGFIVGADVSAFEIASAIVAENPGVYISSITISKVSPNSPSSNPIAIGVNEQAFTNAGYITVNVG